MRKQGLSLVEILIAVALMAIILVGIIPLFPTSLRSDANSRLRSQAVTVAQTWLDRYRQNQEPRTSFGSWCSQSGAVVTCTYDYGHDYASDGVASHDAGMNTNMQDFRSVITASLVQAGANSETWQIEVQVMWDVVGGGSVDLATLANF